MKDVDQFNYKHKDALEISHEFYYVCPWGLIEKGEIPEFVGLMYVDKSNKIKIIKRAQLRKLEAINFYHFQAFAKEFGNKIDHTKIPVKFLGKNITQEDFEKILKERIDGHFEWMVDEEVRKREEEREKKKADIQAMFSRLSRECGFYLETDTKNIPEIERYCKLGKELISDYDFIYHIKNFQKGLNGLLDIINRKKDNSK